MSPITSLSIKKVVDTDFKNHKKRNDLYEKKKKIKNSVVKSLKFRVLNSYFVILSVLPF